MRNTLIKCIVERLVYTSVFTNGYITSPHLPGWNCGSKYEMNEVCRDLNSTTALLYDVLFGTLLMYVQRLRTRFSHNGHTTELIPALHIIMFSSHSSAQYSQNTVAVRRKKK